MQVNGPIPFHAARAYGMPRTSAPATSTQAAGLSFQRAASAGAIPQQMPATATDRIERSAAPPPPSASAAPAPARGKAPADGLVAGHVPGGVDFSGPVPTRGSSLSLYSRAADRVEAATAVNIGRSLDLRA
jgi:hypothetical protein